MFALRGSFHEEWHRYDLALADFGRAITLDPLDPDYHRRRALVWGKKGELRKALEDFDEAIRLQPDAHGSRMDRGYVRYVQRRWSEAAEDFSRQDFRHVYRYSPELGAERFVWIDLARRFEGKPQLGLAAIREYLDWYLDDAAVAGTRDEKLVAWPVPLARFLAGDLSEAELLALTDVNESDSAWEHNRAVEKRRGCHFVLAEWSRAQGLSTQADAHLRRAHGLPAHDPMSWVLAARLASFDAI
ncbi:tetratricopeptide repeat protein [Paludisphaera soli]|uniref:tetratricopeptide repeat protein n=1 Tax=Paludisphaera soli TaxID=2712865 RepID=UPI0013EC4CCE|nr:tetratricopeptide repeat protein [Paludisphaera soli]